MATQSVLQAFLDAATARSMTGGCARHDTGCAGMTGGRAVWQGCARSIGVRARDRSARDAAQACALLSQFANGFHGGYVQFAARLQPHLGLKIADRGLGSGAVHTVYGACVNA